MLVAEKLVFVELHKTGASKLQKLLAEVAGSERPDKTLALAEPLAALGKPVIGYVCDPLAWYYFQWKQGCAGKGELHKRLTDPVRWNALVAKRAAHAQESGKSPQAMEIPAGWGADHATGFWYASAENPTAFREWLRAVLMTRGIRRLVSAAYTHSPLQKFAGLMTYEYFSTFVRGADKLEPAAESHEALWELNQGQAITRLFVRAESTSADLAAVLSEIGIGLSEEQTAAAGALDKAGRMKQVDAFYNDETRGWVLKRDAVMARLFGRGAAGAQPAESRGQPAELAAAAAPVAAPLATEAAGPAPAQDTVSSAAAGGAPAAAKEPLPAPADAPKKKPAKAASKSTSRGSKPAAKAAAVKG